MILTLIVNNMNIILKYGQTNTLVLEKLKAVRSN